MAEKCRPPLPLLSPHPVSQQNAKTHSYLKTVSIAVYRGEFRGVAGDLTLPSQDSTPCVHERYPLYTIFRNLFLVTDPKKFLKAHMVPIYANLEGGAPAEKT